MKFKNWGGLEMSLGLTLLFAVIFVLFPRVDLTVSGWFFDPARGFYLGAVPVLVALRETVWTVSELIFVVILLSMIGGAIWPRVKLLPVREGAFALASLFLGPGLLVNGILKAHWGRARPNSVEEFGGTLSYSPPLVPSDQCLNNCSFVSGEASLVVTTALVLILLSLPRVSVRRGRWVIGVLGVIATATSLLRIFFGGHFLSDVIFAALISAVIVFALHRLIVRKAPAKA